MPVSVLDAAPLGPGMTSAQAIADTLQVALAAEAAGYHRIWIAEHHAAPDNACSQPALLIGLIAARTVRIRVGSGGVMLPNHRPLAVAEQFHTLCAMHGDRIDLGLGRAGGASPLTLAALGRRPGAESDAGFEADLAELTGFLTGNWPEDHPYREVRVSPSGPPPPVYLLGSSTESARRAGRAGLRFAYAGHLRPDSVEAAAAAYRDAVAESPTGSRQARLIVTAGVICADDHAAAEGAALRAGLARLRRSLARTQGRTAAVAELLDPDCDQNEREQVRRMYAAGNFLIGDQTTVAGHLADLAARTGADEIMLASAEFRAVDRIRTMESVATGLAARVQQVLALAATGSG